MPIKGKRNKYFTTSGKSIQVINPTEDKKYIVFMPFIDTGKLHKLNIAYGDNKESKRN